MRAPDRSALKTKPDSRFASPSGSSEKSGCFCENIHSWLPTAPSIIPGTTTGIEFSEALCRNESGPSRLPIIAVTSADVIALAPAAYSASRYSCIFSSMTGP